MDFAIIIEFRRVWAIYQHFTNISNKALEWFKLDNYFLFSENLGIGKNGELPWRLKNELKYFANLTKTTQTPAKKVFIFNILVNINKTKVLIRN